MKSTEKERLEKQTEKRYLWLRFKNGCKSLKGSKARRYALVVFYALVILIWVCNKDRFSLENVELVSPAFVAFSKLTLPITLIGGTAAILILYGTPIGTGKDHKRVTAYRFDKQCRRNTYTHRQSQRRKAIGSNGV